MPLFFTIDHGLKFRFRKIIRIGTNLTPTIILTFFFILFNLLDLFFLLFFLTFAPPKKPPVIPRPYTAQASRRRRAVSICTMRSASVR